MSYKIIGDSCCDLCGYLTDDPHFASVPLVLEIGDYSVADDEDFDQKDFLRRIGASKEAIRSACPSPESYRAAIEDSDADEVYIVTLSNKLSGSWQSASIGADLYNESCEKGKEKKIHVFNSDSAAAGQTNLCLYIQELKEAGASFEELVTKVHEKVENQRTYFVLETLEILRRNGRLSGVKAFLASALNIKPVMAGDNGSIIKLGQERGVKKALRTMCKYAAEHIIETGESEKRRACITYCNCLERAEFVRTELLKLLDLTEVRLIPARGISSEYAADGGIVLAL